MKVKRKSACVTWIKDPSHDTVYEIRICDTNHEIGSEMCPECQPQK